MVLPFNFFGRAGITLSSPISQVENALLMMTHQSRIIPMETTYMSAAQVTPSDPFVAIAAITQAPALEYTSTVVGDLLTWDPFDIISGKSDLWGTPTPTLKIAAQVAPDTYSKTATIPTNIVPGTTALSPALSSTVATSPSASSSDWKNTKIIGTEESLKKTAEDAIEKLLTYDTGSSTGGRFNFADPLAWWQSANAYTAIFNPDFFTNSTEYFNSAGQGLLQLMLLSH